MTAATTRPAELTLPAVSLTALRDALFDAVGPEAGAQAMRQAGHAAGDALFRIFAAGADDPARVPADRFWGELARLFSSRGWGQLTYAQVHDGVGALDAADWAEARGDEPAEQPSCHFTTGLLANVLGQVAGRDVAVLEVECHGRGDQRCRFLFGGADAVYGVYERMAAGAAPDAALAGLG